MMMDDDVFHRRLKCPEMPYFGSVLSYFSLTRRWYPGVRKLSRERSFYCFSKNLTFINAFSFGQSQSNFISLSLFCSDAKWSLEVRIRVVEINNKNHRRILHALFDFLKVISVSGSVNCHR